MAVRNQKQLLRIWPTPDVALIHHSPADALLSPTVAVLNSKVYLLPSAHATTKIGACLCFPPALTKWQASSFTRAARGCHFEPTPVLQISLLYVTQQKAEMRLMRRPLFDMTFALPTAGNPTIDPPPITETLPAKTAVATRRDGRAATLPVQKWTEIITASEVLSRAWKAGWPVGARVVRL